MVLADGRVGAFVVVRSEGEVPSTAYVIFAREGEPLADRRIVAFAQGDE